MNEKSLTNIPQTKNMFCKIPSCPYKKNNHLNSELSYNLKDKQKGLSLNKNTTL